MATNTNERKPGDVDVHKATIHNFRRNRRFDIGLQLASLKIFEDIFKNTMYGSVTFIDRMNSVQELPILGEEFFEVEFESPHFPGKKFKHEFFIYAIKDIQTAPDSKSQMVTLEFISKEHLENNKKLMSVSFKGKRFDEYIKQIVTELNFLHSNTPIARWLETTNTFQEAFAFPYQTCFELIEYFRLFAHKDDDPSSSYMFFENQNGFNFTTLDDLIKNPIQKPIKLQHGSKIQFNPKGDEGQTPQERINTAQAFIFNNLNDTLTSMRRGVYGSKVSVIDFPNKAEIFRLYNIGEDYKAFSHLDGRSAGAKNSDFFIEYISSNKYGAQTQGLFLQKNYLVPENSSRGLTGVLDFLPRRVAYNELLQELPATVQMLGNPNLTAGCLIEIDIPDITHNTTKLKTGEYLKYLSGNWLVGRVCHTIEIDTYKMTLNVFKESFKKKIEEVDPFYNGPSGVGSRGQ